jgi:hypothetical protein
VLAHYREPRFPAARLGGGAQVEPGDKKRGAHNQEKNERDECDFHVGMCNSRILLGRYRGNTKRGRLLKSKETRNLKFEISNLKMEYTEIDLNCKPDSDPEADLKLSA